MLNDQDINKLKSILATKEDIENLASISLKTFTTKEDVREIKNDLADMKELVKGLIVSTDAIAKAVSDLTIEYSAFGLQLSRHERWIKQIAEKVGLTLISE